MLNEWLSSTRRILQLLLIAATLCLTLVAVLSAPAPTVSAAPGDPASPARLLKPDGNLDLSTGFQGRPDLHGWQLTLDGEHGPVFEPASLPDRFQVSGWQVLADQGLNREVVALAVLGSDLYVGGVFDQTGDGTLANLGNIARYDTETETWYALPNQGLDGDVYAMAVLGSDLYVAGAFAETGDGTLTDLGRIARYDTTTNSWHALPNQGFNADVATLAVLGSDLYVGGYFGRTGDDNVVNLNRIVRYDTTNGSWNALPNQGLNDDVDALAVLGSDLYVGGAFDRTFDGTLVDLGRIARYDTAAKAWHALPKKGVNSRVVSLAVSENQLYVGGKFDQSGDGTLNNLGYIAAYDTMTKIWSSLPNQGLTYAYGGEVKAMTVVGSDLYVGGRFTQTADMALNNLGYIARYDITAGSWNALPNQGFNNHIIALAASGSDLYVGGDIQQTSDGALTNLGYIARGPLMVPDIQVLDGTTNIPDGSGSVDFGATLPGAPVDKTFTVSNTGSIELTLTEPITVPHGFSVVDSFGSSTVAPGNATTFNIRLDADAAGSYSGTLQFANNVADKNPFNFTVSSSVQQPLVNVYLPVAMKNWE